MNHENERKNEITANFKAEEAYMEFRVQQGIESNRKDFMKIRVVSETGDPVSQADVEIRQLTHQFKFGANLFLLDEMETEEKNGQYRDVFAEIFNHATLPFYWSDLEPEQDKPRFSKGSPKVYRRPAPDLCLEYCAEKDISPKAHCLVYDAFTPDWVPDDIQKNKEMHRNRLIRLAERYKDQIEDWEVINETLLPYSVPRNRPLFMEPDYVEWAFDMAKSYFPANRLLFNEATDQIWGSSFKYNRGEYYMLTERLLNQGIRIDGIGMQYHMFYPREEEAKAAKTLYNPRRLYDVLDTYAHFRKPVQITEVTIPAYSELAEDEQTQAEIVRNLYRIWFSHESVESIVWWNLVDGYAYVKEDGSWDENMYFGGLLRSDLSTKPAWDVLWQLINEEWRTRETLQTAEDGSLSLRGFFGDYEIEVTVNGRKTVKNLSLSNRDRTREFTVVV